MVRIISMVWRVVGVMPRPGYTSTGAFIGIIFHSILKR